jgi:hypothetical protein
MIQATDVHVIEADDGSGTKALAIDLVLLVPLNEEGAKSVAFDLLGLSAEDQPTTEQDTEEASA